MPKTGLLLVIYVAGLGRVNLAWGETCVQTDALCEIEELAFLCKNVTVTLSLSLCIYIYIYIYIYICTLLIKSFGTTLNCFSKFIKMANFTTEHKVRSELPKNKQELFMHLHIVRESLPWRYFYRLQERMLRICFVIINVREILWWRDNINLLELKW